MRYGSVCSGIGGCAAAWHPLGWETQFFSEIEPFPSAVLAHHHPTIPNLGDFTKIGTESNGIDLLVGGTPCQSFSIAGLRKGLDDERGNLALEFIRLAYRSGARWVVWENVPGVLSSSGGRDFASFIGGLTNVEVPVPPKGWKNSGVLVGSSIGGFSLAWRVLDAQYFGVPQRRRRVFVVGHLGDWRAAAAVLFERHSLQGHPAPSRKAGERVAASLTEGFGSRGVDAEQISNGNAVIAKPLLGKGGVGRFNPDETFITGSTDIARCVTAGEARRQDYETCTFVATLGHSKQNGLGVYETTVAATVEATSSCNQAVAMRQREGCDGGGKGSLLSEEQSLTLAANTNDQTIFQPIGIDGGDIGYSLRSNPSHSGDKGDGGINCTMAVMENVRAELRLSDCTDALTRGGGKPGQGYAAALTGMAVRRLTPRECERLQGYHDDYTLIPYRGKPAADGHRYKALGNSWAVPVVRWIGRRIEEVDKIKGLG